MVNVIMMTIWYVSVSALMTNCKRNSPGFPSHMFSTGKAGGRVIFVAWLNTLLNSWVDANLRGFNAHVTSPWCRCIRHNTRASAMPVQHQAITWSNFNVSSFRTPGINFNESWIMVMRCQHGDMFHEYAFENVVSKMFVMLLRSQYHKTLGCAWYAPVGLRHHNVYISWRLFGAWTSAYTMLIWLWLKTLKQRENGCHFADDIFKCILLNKNAWISMKISLDFVEGCSWQYTSIGSDNGLAPNTRQAIIWTKDGLIY